MVVKSSLTFTYNGTCSTSMNIYNVNFETGFIEEPFLAGREIIEEKIRGRDKPYFMQVKRNPLLLRLSFAFDPDWNPENENSESLLRTAKKWLNQDYYKELYFSDNTDRRYFAMYDGDPLLLHNGLSQGYVEIEMRCDSPYAYSELKTSKEYDLSDNDPTGTKITFSNKGDFTIKPILEIKKIGNGDISIINSDDNDREFKFLELADNEIVWVDNENEYIKTDLPSMYRYDSFNDNYLRFFVGDNDLIVYGDCKIQFQYRFIYL